jgi:vesicle coat complex subunit
VELTLTLLSDPAIINRLYELIRDRDPLVVINALHSLDEILESEGGVVVNQKVMIGQSQQLISQIVLHLMSHMREFNAWGQAFIVELIHKYTPQSEEELFAIMVNQLLAPLTFVRICWILVVNIPTVAWCWLQFTYSSIIHKPNPRFINMYICVSRHP